MMSLITINIWYVIVTSHGEYHDHQHHRHQHHQDHPHQCDNVQVQMLPYQEDWADNTTVTGMSDLMVPTKPLNTGDQVNTKTS